MGVGSAALKAGVFKVALRKPMASFLLATVAFWALYTIWLAFKLGGEEGLRYLSDVVYEVPLVVATITLGLAARRASGRTRIGWALACGGMAAWAVAEWAWSSYDLFFRAEVPVPSVADPLYYLGYIGMTAAVVVLVQLDAGWRGAGKSFLDALIVIVALATFSWHWVLAPIVRSSDVSLLGVSVTLGYPLMDLVMVTLVVLALYRSNWRLPAPIVFLALAELISAVSDTLFLHLSIVQNYDPTGNPVELGWVVAYSLSAMAGFLQWQRGEEARAATNRAQERYSRLGLSLPYLVALPLLGLSIHGVASGSPSLIIAVGTALALACIGLRQWFALVENAQQRRRAEKIVWEQEARFRSVAQSVSDAIIVADSSGEIISWNKGAQTIFGYGTEEVLGKPLALLMPERYRDAHRKGLERVRSTGRSNLVGKTIELRGLRKDGSEFPLELSLGGWKAAEGTFVSGIIRDITERKRAEAVRERLAAILEATPDFVATANPEGRLLYINSAGRRMLGISPDEDVTEMSIPDLLPDWERQRILGEAMPAGLRDGIWSGEVAFVHRDGREVPVSLVGLAQKKADGAVEFSCIARDISERKRFEEQLTHLASHDPLTDLFNRRRFQEELEHQLAQARRHGNKGALLLLDLDNFKDVNDTLGHRTGDDVLMSVAVLLRERLRESDILARLGGDEFAILLPQSDSEQAQILAGQILAALRQHTTVVSGRPTSTTASIGIALFSDHGGTAEELLAHADLAMYHAKEKGRDDFCLYTHERDWKERTESRFAWERRIREALQKERFLLYCQPILDLHSPVSRYEVLLRMIGDNGEVIPPAYFLPIAERCGLIQAIDRWVVRQAIHLIAAQQQANRDICLEVNLSAKAFEDGDLLPMIKAELAATGANPAHLVFEITETAVIADIGHAQRFISALKGLGCQFAIDDFGVGFSSFYYLKHLPVDYLKIDGAFIRNFRWDSVDQHLVKAIVEVARGLGKQTIAEFVGDEETVCLLREAGVDFVQGYHIGRPNPVAEALAEAVAVPAAESDRPTG